MRAIGRALDELIGVLAAGFVGFFVMLAYITGGLIWFACGVVCFCSLLVALFGMVMWLLTGGSHAFGLMLGYFVYAGAAYAGIAVISYYRGRLTGSSHEQTRAYRTRKDQPVLADRRFAR